MAKHKLAALAAIDSTDQIVFVAQGNLDGTGETLSGNALDNLMVGHRYDDTILGNGGADTIYGGYGNDTIDGGAGNDHIEGGSGDDQLTGGAGSDTFVFRWYEGHDTIHDFEAGDKILVADYPVASYEIVAGTGGVDWTILFHTVASDPTWDFSVDIIGSAPTDANFVFGG